MVVLFNMTGHGLGGGISALAASHSASEAMADDNATDANAVFARAVAAVKAKDYSRAVILFEQLADTNAHDAQYNLALLLRAGKGRPQDYISALDWAWSAQLGGIEIAADLADEISELLPEEAVESARNRVSTRLQARIADQDKPAITQFAQFHLTLKEEPDFARAYIWYAIGAALGLEGSIAARDEVEEEIEPEELIKLQQESREVFDGLNIVQ